MRIGIVGVGAIGGYVGGKLAAVGDVILVGRPRVCDELAQHGLATRDFDGAPHLVRPRCVSDPVALADRDAIFVCVKSAQTAEVAQQLANTAATVVSLQNGVHNADVLRTKIARVVAGIVNFNVRSLGSGVFQRTTSGSLALDAGGGELAPVLRAAGLPTDIHADIGRHQWTKLLVNLNNAVSALSDTPTKQMLRSRPLRRVIAALLDEGLAVLRAADIRAAPLRGVPVGVMPWLLRSPLPVPAKIDPEARSSMWEDLAKNRPTEVDYLNGEIVALAKQHGIEAPLNRRIVELVHAAEGNGSPKLSGDALWSALTT